MTDGLLVARALQTAPFLEIYEMDENDNPSAPFQLDPPPASTPVRVGFPRDNSQMTIVTEFRRDLISGIGNPAQEIPTAGLRLIAPDEAFIFFGGNATSSPVMFMRRGPGYSPFDLDLPSAVDYVTAAVFSNSSRYLFVVGDDDDTLVRVLRRSTTKFELIHEIECSHSVSRLTIDQGESYLILSSGSGSTIHVFQDSEVNPFPEKSGAPTGVFLGISPNGRWYIMLDGSSVKAWEHSSGSWTEKATLTSPPASPTYAIFSPDGSMVAVEGTTTVVYSVTGGTFYRSGVTTNSKFIAGNSRFTPDSELYLHTHSGGIDVLARTLVPTNPFFNVGTTIDLSDYKATNSNNRARPSFNGKFLTIRADDGSVDVYEWNSASKEYQLRGSTPSGAITYTWGMVPITDDGSTLLIVNSTNARTYRWDGEGYELHQTVATASGIYGFHNEGDISANGKRLAFGIRGTGSPAQNTTLQIYELNESTDQYESVYTQSFNAITQYSYFYQYAFSPSGDTLFLVGTGNVSGAMVRSVHSSWSSNVATNSVLGYHCCVFLNSDDFVITHRTSAGAGSARYFKFNPITNTYTNVTTSNLPTGAQFDTGIYGRGGAWFQNDSILILPTASFPFARAFKKIGDVFTELPGFADEITSKVDFFIAIDDRYLSLGDGRDLKELIDPPPIEYRKYEVALDRTIGGISARIIDSVSPEGTILHAGTNHFDLTDDFATLSELPFDDEYGASSIHSVLWGSTGRFVLYVNPDGPSLSVKTSPTSGFQMSKKLNGLFVAKYVRSGETLTETEFVMHSLDEEITDLVYSDYGAAMSYFLRGNPATLGRYIYNTADDFLELKGVHSLPTMEASFLAFSPHETHFVVTYKMSDDAHDLRLFQLGPDRSFTEEDSRLVAFGPVDLSYCDQVIVAHGGEPEPFSMFQIEDWEINPLPFPLVDWEFGGLIWGVTFSDDCGGLLVLTPTELIGIDLEEGVVTDIDEHGIPPENAPPEGGFGKGGFGRGGGTGKNRFFYRNYRGYGGGGSRGRGGGGGGWGWNRGPIDNRTYYPHSFVEVTYRS